MNVLAGLAAQTPGFSRRSRLSLVFVAATGLAALGLQSLLPIAHPALSQFNLPLLVVVYVVSTIRAVIPAMLFAMLVGWAQDGLTSEPIGMLGIVYLVLGYLTATLSRYLKVGLALVHGLLVASAYLLHEVLVVALAYFVHRPGAEADLVLWAALAALHTGLALLLYPPFDRLAEGI